METFYFFYFFYTFVMTSFAPFLIDKQITLCCLLILCDKWCDDMTENITAMNVLLYN